MKKVVILHAWQANPDDFWYKTLGVELSMNGFNVLIPSLCNKDLPTLKDWDRSVTKKVLLDNESIIIGHSLGAVLGLRIAEKVKLEKLVLVSGWDFWDLTPEHKTFFKKPFDYDLIGTNVRNVCVVYSDNDFYISQYQSEKLAERLRAERVLLHGWGHFVDTDTTIAQKLAQMVDQ